MSDILVTPYRSGWTVRHERCLFEQFETRAAAIQRAHRLSRLLNDLGLPAKLRCDATARALQDRAA